MNFISRLPDELLVKIFSYVGNNLLLRQVCSKWRKILPMRKLYITFDEGVSQLDWYRHSKVFNVFERIPYPKDCLYVDFQDEDEFIEMLKIYSELEYVYIISIESNMLTIFDIVNNNCPSLEHLFVSSSCGKLLFKDIIEHIPNLVPQLRTLIFENIEYANDGSIEEFFQKTTELELFHLYLNSDKELVELKYVPKHLKDLFINCDLEVDNSQVDHLKHFGFLLDNRTLANSFHRFPRLNQIWLNSRTDQKLRKFDVEHVTSRVERMMLMVQDINEGDNTTTRLLAEIISKQTKLEYLKIDITCTFKRLFDKIDENALKNVRTLIYISDNWIPRVKAPVKLQIMQKLKYLILYQPLGFPLDDLQRTFEKLENLRIFLFNYANKFENKKSFQNMLEICKKRNYDYKWDRIYDKEFQLSIFAFNFIKKAIFT